VRRAADTTGVSKRVALILLAAISAVCLVAIPSAASGDSTPTCNLVASPSGSDSAPGSVAAPFQTAQKLASSLTAGETGCLEAGTYSENVTFRNGGTAGAPITLTSYPGQTATIVGRVYVAEGANYTTVTGLDLDGSNPGLLESPTIDANDVTFSYDDVTNDHTGICFGIGSATWGWATDTLITHDRVHDCGQLPATNLQHAFYIGGATDTTIEWNLIYANADRGIQLYPEALGTTVDHNIIDDNGEGILISGAEGVASSDTDVYDNIISNANQRHDVESYWPAGNPVGVGNVVHDNCVWGGVEGTIDTSSGGYTASDNLTVDPEFVNAAAHDYEMSPTSPCLALVGDVQAAVERPARVQLPAGATPPVSPPTTTSGSGSGSVGGPGSPTASVKKKKTLPKRKTTLHRKPVAHVAKHHARKRRRKSKAKPRTARR
jgi:Right handed beta helix region